MAKHFILGVESPFLLIPGNYGSGDSRFLLPAISFKHFTNARFVALFLAAPLPRASAVAYH